MSWEGMRDECGTEARARDRNIGGQGMRRTSRGIRDGDIGIGRHKDINWGGGRSRGKIGTSVRGKGEAEAKNRSRASARVIGNISDKNGTRRRKGHRQGQGRGKGRGRGGTTGKIRARSKPREVYIVSVSVRVRAGAKADAGVLPEGGSEDRGKDRDRGRRERTASTSDRASRLSCPYLSHTLCAVCAIVKLLWDFSDNETALLSNLFCTSKLNDLSFIFQRADRSNSNSSSKDRTP